MHTWLIANPAAGTAQAPEAAASAIARLRTAGHRVVLCETTGPEDAERDARAAVQAGADLVVSAGGDGTLNQVVNGVASENGLSQCAIGLLPLGTGNDFARGLGLTDGVEQATDVLVAGHQRQVDLVRLDDRVFLNASAGGFTAETSANVTSDLKRVAGKLAYLIGGARALLEYSPVPVRIEGGGHVVETDLQLFAVCNGAYIGGGHQLAPTARLDDGLVEVCVVRATSSPEFLALLPRLSSGDHIEDDDVVYFRTKEVTLTFARPIKVNTDGEVLEASRCHYRVAPGAVRVLAPRQTATEVGT